MADTVWQQTFINIPIQGTLPMWNRVNPTLPGAALTLPAQSRLQSFWTEGNPH